MVSYSRYSHAGAVGSVREQAVCKADRLLLSVTMLGKYSILSESNGNLHNMPKCQKYHNKPTEEVVDCTSCRKRPTNCLTK